MSFLGSGSPTILVTNQTRFKGIETNVLSLTYSNILLLQTRPDSRGLRPQPTSRCNRQLQVTNQTRFKGIETNILTPFYFNCKSYKPDPIQGD